jgi:hypothetical protein
MATSPKGPQGPGADEVTKRLGEAVKGSDDVLRLTAELAARVEKTKAGGLARERARLARKHGSGSAEAARAESSANAQRLALEAAVAEVQSARIPVAPLDAETIRVHGRAVDRTRAGIAGIEARLRDQSGRTAAKAATDENGYFRLDVEPRAKPSRPKAAGRRIVLPPETAEGSADASGAPEETSDRAGSPAWELVLQRGHQELYRESIRDLAPGQAVYREPVLEPPSK